MPNATLGYPCSAVYVIDAVLLPGASLADITPFSEIRALLLARDRGPHRLTGREVKAQW